MTATIGSASTDVTPGIGRRLIKRLAQHAAVARPRRPHATTAADARPTPTPAPHHHRSGRPPHARADPTTTATDTRPTPEPIPTPRPLRAPGGA
ncbi:hypothetical protein L083_5773 [Actinoplanes sp. N902-109]|nr:hypothetical protein L083_5773 [Actinoplanes sp. N902-109]